MKTLKEKKEKSFELKAQFFKLLSSPIKLKLLQFISFAPRTVEECALKFDQSIQNISLHLLSLHKANILEVLKVKNFRFYSLSEGQYFELIDQALGLDRQSLLPAELLYDKSAKDLAQEIRSKRMLLVDLRSPEETFHLPLNNSISFTEQLKNLPSFLSSLPKGKMILLLCKGKLCERLAEAVLMNKMSDLNIKGLAFSAKEVKALQLELAISNSTNSTL